MCIKNSCGLCHYTQPKGGWREIQTFTTMTGELLKSDWLISKACTHVAMEYWRILKPIFNILESSFEVMLVNAQHIKGACKLMKDAQWIAELLQHGLCAQVLSPPSMRPTGPDSLSNQFYSRAG